MGEQFELGTLYFRNKENWFKELLYKIKILKPKYKELGKKKILQVPYAKALGTERTHWA